MKFPERIYEWIYYVIHKSHEIGFPTYAYAVPVLVECRLRLSPTHSTFCCRRCCCWGWWLCSSCGCGFVSPSPHVSKMQLSIDHIHMHSSTSDIWSYNNNNSPAFQILKDQCDRIVFSTTVFVVPHTVTTRCTVYKSFASWRNFRPNPPQSIISRARVPRDEMRWGTKYERTTDRLSHHCPMMIVRPINNGIMYMLCGKKCLLRLNSAEMLARDSMENAGGAGENESSISGALKNNKRFQCHRINWQISIFIRVNAIPRKRNDEDDDGELPKQSSVCR